ncbi:Ribonuclease BN, tRNA processing enzyme [Geosporobacter subterraneus DSM 17957]|uniref:Ribonuclease BN, tRNA processing enzyme n=1 Tax=Geosporobacter subterraneus DSM 17957 TaxID=1121919 RepID=A0A1M6JGD6_9FIRM|nr:MBL fold metallo-hydrolase [Geosporobacter subterraneus]SHJ45756.1 Ribonuclease BN, tRNA processing enzyme [Geosporobacter subterraneus DSM 17957]
MQLTILGNWGPYPNAGGACSGYLFEGEGIKILIDCGNGTLSRLQQRLTTLEELDLIILSHLHSDHISDAMILRYAVGINKMKGLFHKTIPLYAPATPEEDFQKLQYENAFVLQPIDENLVIYEKGLKICFRKMDHPVEAYAVAIENDEKKFVFSADTRYCSQLVDFSKNADLLLCEAGVLERDKATTTPHLSALEAGQIATQAQVKKLVLTHFWPGYHLQEVLEEARNAYDGELILSEEMQSYEL